jgi:hypothetical protein
MDSAFGALTSFPTPARAERLSPTSRASSTAAISEEEFMEQKGIGALDATLVAINSAFYSDYGRQIDARSSVGLARFVRYNTMITAPSIGADASGRLIATWRNGQEALSLLFTDRLTFTFALTTIGDQGLERSWGSGHALTFFAREPRANRFTTNG